MEIRIQPTRREGAHFALGAAVLAQHASHTYLQWFEGFHTVFSDGTRVLQNMFRKLGSALACHTGQEEGEKIDHLVKRVSILLQKGLSAMLLNRIPGHPAAEVDGLL